MDTGALNRLKSEFRNSIDQDGNSAKAFSQALGNLQTLNDVSEVYSRSAVSDSPASALLGKYGKDLADYQHFPSHQLDKREKLKLSDLDAGQDGFIMMSENGENGLVFDRDGNLVMLRPDGARNVFNFDPGQPGVKNIPYENVEKIELQSDGNLVIRNQDGAVLFALGASEIESIIVGHDGELRTNLGSMPNPGGLSDVYTLQDDASSPPPDIAGSLTNSISAFAVRSQYDESFSINLDDYSGLDRNGDIVDLFSGEANSGQIDLGQEMEVTDIPEGKKGLLLFSHDYQQALLLDKDGNFVSLNTETGEARHVIDFDPSLPGVINDDDYTVGQVKFQSDGNLVIKSADGENIYSLASNGKVAGFVFDGNGNLSVEKDSGEVSGIKDFTEGNANSGKVTGAYGPDSSGLGDDINPGIDDWVDVPPPSQGNVNFVATINGPGGEIEIGLSNFDPESQTVLQTVEAVFDGIKLGGPAFLSSYSVDLGSVSKSDDQYFFIAKDHILFGGDDIIYSFTLEEVTVTGPGRELEVLDVDGIINRGDQDQVRHDFSNENIYNATLNLLKTTKGELIKDLSDLDYKEMYLASLGIPSVILTPVWDEFVSENYHDNGGRRLAPKDMDLSMFSDLPDFTDDDIGALRQIFGDAAEFGGFYEYLLDEGTQLLNRDVFKDYLSQSDQAGYRRDLAVIAVIGGIFNPHSIEAAVFVGSRIASGYSGTLRSVRLAETIEAMIGTGETIGVLTLPVLFMVSSTYALYEYGSPTLNTGDAFSIEGTAIAEDIAPDIIAGLDLLPSEGAILKSSLPTPLDEQEALSIAARLNTFADGIGMATYLQGLLKNGVRQVVVEEALSKTENELKDVLLDGIADLFVNGDPIEGNYADKVFSDNAFDPLLDIAYKFDGDPNTQSFFDGMFTRFSGLNNNATGTLNGFTEALEFATPSIAGSFFSQWATEIANGDYFANSSKNDYNVLSYALDKFRKKTKTGFEDAMRYIGTYEPDGFETILLQLQAHIDDNAPTSSSGQIESRNLQGEMLDSVAPSNRVKHLSSLAGNPTGTKLLEVLEGPPSPIRNILNRIDVDERAETLDVLEGIKIYEGLDDGTYESLDSTDARVAFLKGTTITDAADGDNDLAQRIRAQFLIEHGTAYEAADVISKIGPTPEIQGLMIAVAAAGNNDDRKPAASGGAGGSGSRSGNIISSLTGTAFPRNDASGIGGAGDDEDPNRPVGPGLQPPGSSPVAGLTLDDVLASLRLQGVHTRDDVADALASSYSLTDEAWVNYITVRMGIPLRPPQPIEIQDLPLDVISLLVDYLAGRALDHLPANWLLPIATAWKGNIVAIHRLILDRPAAEAARAMTRLPRQRQGVLLAFMDSERRNAVASELSKYLSESQNAALTDLLRLLSDPPLEEMTNGEREAIASKWPQIFRSLDYDYREELRPQNFATRQLRLLLAKLDLEYGSPYGGRRTDIAERLSELLALPPAEIDLDVLRRLSYAFFEANDIQDASDLYAVMKDQIGTGGINIESLPYFQAIVSAWFDYISTKNGQVPDFSTVYRLQIGFAQFVSGIPPIENIPHSVFSEAASHISRSWWQTVAARSSSSGSAHSGLLSKLLSFVPHSHSGIITGIPLELSRVAGTAFLDIVIGDSSHVLGPGVDRLILDLMVEHLEAFLADRDEDDGDLADDRQLTAILNFYSEILEQLIVANGEEIADYFVTKIRERVPQIAHLIPDLDEE